MRKFGEFVHSLSGRYITAEDVGMETADMDIVEMLPLMLLEFQRKEVELETHHLSQYGVCRYESCCKTTIWFDVLSGKKY
jgi:leucine dehydrogenase